MQVGNLHVTPYKGTLLMSMNPGRELRLPSALSLLAVVLHSRVSNSVKVRLSSLSPCYAALSAAFGFPLVCFIEVGAQRQVACACPFDIKPRLDSSSSGVSRQVLFTAKQGVRKLRAACR